MMDTFMFQVGNAKYQIGSKLFPVADKGHTRTFTTDNTSEIDIPILADKLNRTGFESGFCYLNSSTVLRIGIAMGLPVKFHAGWVFVGHEYPVHHAWVTLGTSLIDMSISRREMEILHQVNYSNPKWREAVAPKLLQLRSVGIALADDRIFGKVPERLVYVGCPDDDFNAKRTFRMLINRYPRHPSYPGISANGASKLQQILGSMSNRNHQYENSRG
jgi:hypothetical protein